MAALGLRGKSLLALLLSCLLAFVFAGFIGREALLGVQSRFGEAYARNVVQLNRERLFAPVSRELALAQRLAASQLTLAWLNDEQDPAKRKIFFQEAAGYQQAFGDHAYFAASASSNGYYSNGPDQSPSDVPRYVMAPDGPRDEWFFQTLQADTPYAINVDRSVVTGELKVWFNVQVRDGDRRLGLVGSGISLQAFLDDFIEANKVGVESMVLDAYGSILVHPNQNLVTLNAETARGRSLSTSILGQLDDLGAASAVRQAMAESRENPGTVATLRVTLDGAPRLLALSWIPELQWFVASAVDLGTAQVVEVRPLLPAIALFLVLFLLLIGGGAWLVEKRVLKPLRQLRRSAQALAAGQYDAPPCPCTGRTRSANSAQPSVPWRSRFAATPASWRVACVSAPATWNRPTWKWPPRTRRSTTRSTMPALSSARSCPTGSWSPPWVIAMRCSGGHVM